MLPRVAAGVATVEDDHLVVVNVGVHQVGAGDMAHVQRAVRALEYQDLADGVVLAHGVDAGSELVLEVRCARNEVGEHEVAPMKMDQPDSWGRRAGMRGQRGRPACRAAASPRPAAGPATRVRLHRG